MKCTVYKGHNTHSCNTEVATHICIHAHMHTQSILNASCLVSVPSPHASYLSPKGGGALSHAMSHSGVSSGMIQPALLITGHYAWW